MSQPKYKAGDVLIDDERDVLIIIKVSKTRYKYHWSCWEDKEETSECPHTIHDDNETLRYATPLELLL